MLSLAHTTDQHSTHVLGAYPFFSAVAGFSLCGCLQPGARAQTVSMFGEGHRVLGIQ